ncbi:NERD domain-containing protein [Caldimonas tepidiphila]|uniref:NERD domain-containing protein n=1 Tax=Caldimonas tepidiphila TaxID=2315841 RepID=UPI00147509F9|nr:NERD domain-containing protein [Caldimonas tepidiphila]
MARLFPSSSPKSALSAGDYQELQILATLERGLPDAYTLFHSVDWAQGTDGGEIDIVVVNQAGDVLLIEVKAGTVEVEAGGIFKRYSSGTTKNVVNQVRGQLSGIRTRLSECGLKVRLHHLLVLPGVRVLHDTVQWPRAQIVDANEVEQLVSRVRDVLDVGVHGPLSDRVLAFFENRFRVAVDVSALVGRLQTSTTRLSAGLATWVPRMQIPSGLLRVRATAGSGKTQLALRLMRDGAAGGAKVAYLCFNRPLADHIARLVPDRVHAETFHEFAWRLVRGSEPEAQVPRTPQAFDAVTTRAIQLLAARDPDLDLLVLDEVQDLHVGWIEALLGRLRPQGRAVLLEDPDQQLYLDRDEFDIADAVTIRCTENYRSPRALVRLVNLLQLADSEIEALGLHEGEAPDPLVYDTTRELERATQKAVERCLERGFAMEDIAVVSLRGLGNSHLLASERLGDWRMRRFLGRYDAQDQPVWSDGELLVESVRRFKGQAAPAIVLTECDFEELDELQRRLLFVGMTRARVHLEWVVSSRTVKALENALN